MFGTAHQKRKSVTSCHWERIFFFLNKKVQADIQAWLSSLKVEKKRFGWKERSNILLRHNHGFLVHRLVIYHPSIFSASNCESLWGTYLPWHNGHDKPTHSHSWAMINGVLSNEAFCATLALSNIVMSSKSLFPHAFTCTFTCWLGLCMKVCFVRCRIWLWFGLKYVHSKKVTLHIEKNNELKAP